MTSIPKQYHQTIHHLQIYEKQGAKILKQVLQQKIHPQKKTLSHHSIQTYGSYSSRQPILLPPTAAILPTIYAIKPSKNVKSILPLRTAPTTHLFLVIFYASGILVLRHEMTYQQIPAILPPLYTQSEIFSSMYPYGKNLTPIFRSKIHFISPIHDTWHRLQKIVVDDEDEEIKVVKQKTIPEPLNFLFQFPILKYSHELIPIGIVSNQTVKPILPLHRQIRIFDANGNFQEENLRHEPRKSVIHE